VTNTRAAEMVLLRSISAVLSLLLGGKVSLVARPPAAAPLALLSARCEEFSLSITEGRRILPFKCAAPVKPRTREMKCAGCLLRRPSLATSLRSSLTIEGESVQLGWKAPALLLAPLWYETTPREGPSLVL